MEYPYVDFHFHGQHASAFGTVGFPTLRIKEQFELPSHGLYWLGIHPWDASTPFTRLEELYASIPTRFAGIGEIGLDKLREESSFALQQQLFESQFEFAVSHSLPITLHCVKAYNELLPVLKSYQYPRAVLHGFVGSVQTAAQALETGCRISFAPQAFHSPKTVETMQQIPLDRLFLESDMTGAPIEASYTALANLRGITEPQLRQRIYENWTALMQNE